MSTSCNFNGTEAYKRTVTDDNAAAASAEPAVKGC